MDIKKFIRDVPDFPKKGILFKDITPLLSSPAAFTHALSLMADYVMKNKADAVAAIESRGFLFAAPVAQKLGLPFIPIRKPGKLPHITKSIEYSLEYGSGRLEIHQDALKAGMKVAIIDDLLATGGTAHGASSLIELCGGSVCSYSFLIELAELGGRKALKNSSIQALITY